MKRSEINTVYHEAKACFEANGWTLPPNPRWDITDFGLGKFDQFGLTLINLAEEVEYCEKLMYARKGQTTPLHTHKQKKEDIICRSGRLALELWSGHPENVAKGMPLEVPINGEKRMIASGDVLNLAAGERITLKPGIYHAFWPASEGCIIGEVSTANDDTNDNLFVNPSVGRFPGIEEDTASAVKLISETRGA